MIYFTAILYVLAAISTILKVLSFIDNVNYLSLMFSYAV